MKILSLSLDRVTEIAVRMRAIDHAEIFATRADEDPAQLAAEAVACTPYGAVGALNDGTPVAAVGAIEAWPGVCAVWMFATDDWLKIARPFGRWVNGTLKPQLITAGFHRAECHSLDRHLDAHRWMEFLGMKRESIARCYGKKRETFYVYAWCAEDQTGVRG